MKFKDVFAFYGIYSTNLVMIGRKRVVMRTDTGYPQNIFLWAWGVFGFGWFVFETESNYATLIDFELQKYN